MGIGKATDMHARALVSLKESAFTAVWGRSKEKTENYASGYRVKAYTDVVEMVSRERIEVVITCTPLAGLESPCLPL